jgi:hypothetical protein
MPDWHNYINYAPEPSEDQVNSPSHYNTGSIEAWDYIKDNLGDEAFVAYCDGTVKKYMHRWKYKEKPLEDLKKARAYLNKMIETLED